MLLADDPGSAILLGDEIAEDPRCRVLIMGSDAYGVVLLTLWDAEVIDEVEEGLREQGLGLVRRLTVPADSVIWR